MQQTDQTPEPFHYTTTYVLDKSHFAETYDQTATVVTGFQAYIKSILIILVGIAVFAFVPLDPYIGGFIIVLGCVELLSVRFQRAWWLARQMISRAANMELTLTIDEKGVSSESAYVKSNLLWEQVERIEATDCGWLLYQGKSKTYISNRCLSEPAKQYLADKAQS